MQQTRGYWSHSATAMLFFILFSCILSQCGSASAPIQESEESSLISESDLDSYTTLPMLSYQDFDTSESDSIEMYSKKHSYDDNSSDDNSSDDSSSEDETRIYSKYGCQLSEFKNDYNTYSDYMLVYKKLFGILEKYSVIKLSQKYGYYEVTIPNILDPLLEDPETELLTIRLRNGTISSVTKTNVCRPSLFSPGDYYQTYSMAYRVGSVVNPLNSKKTSAFIGDEYEILESNWGRVNGASQWYEKVAYHVETNSKRYQDIQNGSTSFFSSDLSYVGPEISASNQFSANNATNGTSKNKSANIYKGSSRILSVDGYSDLATSFWGADNDKQGCSVYVSDGYYVADLAGWWGAEACQSDWTYDTEVCFLDDVDYTADPCTFLTLAQDGICPSSNGSIDEINCFDFEPVSSTLETAYVVDVNDAPFYEYTNSNAVINSVLPVDIIPKSDQSWDCAASASSFSIKNYKNYAGLAAELVALHQELKQSYQRWFNVVCDKVEDPISSDESDDSDSEDDEDSQSNDSESDDNDGSREHKKYRDHNRFHDAHHECNDKD